MVTSHQLKRHPWFRRGPFQAVDRIHDSRKEGIRLRVLERFGEQEALEDAERDGGIASMLHDFSPAAVLAG